MLSQDLDGLYILVTFEMQKQLLQILNFYKYVNLTNQILYNSISLSTFQKKMATIPDDPSVIEPIFQDLKKNFKSHQTKDLSFRKDALKNLLTGYKQLRTEFDQALKKDLGYNSFMSLFAAHSLFQAQTQHLISNFKSWASPKSVPTPLGLGLATCQIQPEPLGVVLVISAWNYPIYTALPLVAYAIASGNAVILKPSQIAGYTSNVLLKLFNKYMDSRFYRCIEGKVEVAKAITKIPFDLICFTGSTITGRLVGMEAAKNLTPCILQLGGKCPVIVDETANIDSACMRILFGKFFNCGQTCIGVDHVYVHESVKEIFKKTLIATAEQFYGNGQNLSQEGNYGRIINNFHVKRLQKLIKDQHKGQIIYGGQIEQSKNFISPTIILQPKKNSLMMQQQIFGPILPIFTYSKIEDVIQEINNRDKPLVVYHFTQSSKLIDLVKNSTSSGAYTVNDAVVQMLNNYLPFGGVGKSGYGRFHGQAGVQAFSNPKSICKTKALNSYPLSVRFPPYTQSKVSTMTMLLKFGGITYGALFKALIIIVILIAALTTFLVLKQ